MVINRMKRPIAPLIKGYIFAITYAEQTHSRSFSPSLSPLTPSPPSPFFLLLQHSGTGFYRYAYMKEDLPQESKPAIPSSLPPSPPLKFTKNRSREPPTIILPSQSKMESPVTPSTHLSPTLPHIQEMLSLQAPIQNTQEKIFQDIFVGWHGQDYCFGFLRIDLDSLLKNLRAEMKRNHLVADDNFSFIYKKVPVRDMQEQMLFVRECVVKSDEGYHLKIKSTL